jgi:hypothetical protein
MLLVAVPWLLAFCHFRAAINLACFALPASFIFAKCTMASDFSTGCFNSVYLLMLVQLHQLHP